jgi:hypothetical protein
VLDDEHPHRDQEHSIGMDPENRCSGIFFSVDTAYHRSAIPPNRENRKIPNPLLPNRGLRRMMSISPRIRTQSLVAAGAFFLCSPVFAGQPVEFVYDGKVVVEAHLEKPHDMMTRVSRQRFFYDGENRARLEWTTWVEGDSTSTTETTLLLGDRVLMQGHGRTTWLEPKGDQKDEARFQVLAGIQPMLIAESQKGELLCGRPWKLTIDDVGVLTAAFATFSHPRLGDTGDSLFYGAPAADLPGRPPRVIKLDYTQRHDQIWLTTKINTASIPDEKLLKSKLATPPDSMISMGDPLRASPPKIEKIADKIWAIDRNDVDSRTLVAETKDGLVVMESAMGSPEGEQLVDMIKKQWPNQPIRTFLYSHYHPHYLAGVRPFVAEGATIVTTPGNEAFVKEIVSRPFKIAPDRLAQSGATLKLETIQDKRYTISDPDNEIVAIDVGKLSLHTDEFLIFYFPRQKLLFQAELGWFTQLGQVRPSKRSKGLLAAIDENKLDVERIVQSWPVAGNQREMSIKELRSLAGEK